MFLFLQTHRYFILCAFLLVLMIFHAINGLWYEDFWMHSSVIRELSTHPFSPRHPELSINAPHAFYSPYSLGVAWISKLFNINSITALSAAGIFNFLLFVMGLRMFLSLLLGNDKSSFYTLFFTLFLWGAGAWEYSGFFHFGVIGYVLPYPSTFAMGLTFLSLSMAILFLKNGGKAILLCLLLCSVIVLLTHPLSAIILFIGIAALAINYKNYFILSIIPASFLIGLAWPYYPLLKLILFEGKLLDVDNTMMYHGVWRIILPALIGLPALALRIKSNWRDPLSLMFAGLVLVYAYGGITSHFTYGRVISSIVLILHIALADWLCRNERFKILTLRAKCFFILILVFSLLGIFNNCNANCLGYKPGLKNNYSQYFFLDKYTKQYDVILSDLKTSSLVPTFGGKVIAVNSQLPFVKDYGKRQSDVDLFLNNDISLNSREDILKKYRVNFILINKTNPAGTTSLESLSSLGSTIYTDKNFVLIKINL